MSPKTQKLLRWHPAAEEDLQAISESIGEHAPRTAGRFVEAILRKVEILRDLPYLGAVTPQVRRVRFLTHKKYIIYYTVHRREVVVRAVVRGARLFQSSWFRRGED